MSDSTSLLEQIDGSQAEHEVTANNLFDAASAGAAYGRHAEACAGLTWGYYGTRYGGSAVANGTNACGASTTTYMVVNLSTGAVSFATSTTNWNDSAIYGRAYKIVTGTATVTSYEDHRFGPLGIFGAAGSASQLSALTDVAVAGSPGPSDGAALIYDTALGKWVAQSLNDARVFLNRKQVLTDGANIAVNADLGLNCRVVLAGNRTLDNPTNLVDGDVLNFRIHQDGTGSRTLAYGSKYKFPGGSAPVLSTAASAKDFMSCQYDATDDTLYCSMLKAFA